MMNLYRIFLPLLSLFANAICVVVHYSKDYCDLNSIHILCAFRGVGTSCTEFHEILPDLKQQEKILNWHNGIRQKIAYGYKGTNPQHPASNMMKMKWDNELAIMAQVMANQCLTYFNCPECRGVLEGRFAVGQNSVSEAEAKMVRIDFEKLMNKWFSQYVKMPPNNVNSYVPSNQYDQYSQLVWWNTRSVGCGASTFKSKGPYFPYRYQIYCLYGPAGNIPHRRMYFRGEPCSRCPEGTECDSQFPGLCSMKRSDFNVLEEFSTDKKQLQSPLASAFL